MRMYVQSERHRMRMYGSNGSKEGCQAVKRVLVMVVPLTLPSAKAKNSDVLFSLFPVARALPV